MKTILTAILTASALLAIPAQAAQTDEVIVRVSRAGLDLTTQGGAAAMLQRIEMAAEKACADHGSRDLSARNQARKCAAKATQLTVAGLNAPLVTALYKGEAAATRLASAE